MDLSKIKKVYLIGVKGVGMAMLAQYFRGLGIEVVGSDVAEKFMTDEPLIKAGVTITEGFKAENLPSNADLIIYSTAYNSQNNPEIAQAVNGKIRTISYAIALSEIFNQKYGIAVVGTHGKTTTSAWLAFVLDRVGLKPNAMIGAVVPQFNGSSLISRSDYLIAEVDEYQNKIKYFNPKGALLNNIEYDHPDYFPTFSDYQNVFIEMIKKIPSKGFLVANFDDPVIRKLAAVNCRGHLITYAINEAADFVAYDLRQQAGLQFFKVKMAVEDDESGFANSTANDEYNLSESELGDFSIQLAGRHNIYNALAVIATAIELGVGLVDIRKALPEFKGTARRMQVMGVYRGATIVDDYAHHPTEIKATLNGVRQLYPKNFLRVVFHPHTYTRTLALLDDLATSFELADELIVLDIYGSAREQQGGVHSKDLIDKIKKHNHIVSNQEQKVIYKSTLEEVEGYLREEVNRNEVVVLMGAGDVFRVGERLINS